MWFRSDAGSSWCRPQALQAREPARKRVTEYEMIGYRQWSAEWTCIKDTAMVAVVTLVGFFLGQGDVRGLHVQSCEDSCGADSDLSPPIDTRGLIGP